MNKKGGVFLTILVTVFCIHQSLFAATYSGGSGTVAFPYQIGTKADLQTLAATPTDYAKYFILTSDIDLAGETFTRAVIAPDTTVSNTFQGTPFTGVFDGAGYVISNLNITTTTGYYIGLFGYVGSGGQITNLGLEDVTVTGYQYVAGLCGYNASGAIEQCYVTGSITAAYYYVGPLCGYNDYGTISQCYAHAAVAGGACAGGVLGDNYCGTISQCYAAGTVTGTSSVSGVCGYQYGTPALIENCFWDTDTSGLNSGYRQSTAYPGTIVNVVGKTTAQMQTQSTFTAAGWDFSDTDGDPADWTMPNNDYPKLAGEFIQKYSGGSGTEEDPYQIADAEDLITLGEDPNDYGKSFILINDIDLDGYDFSTAVIAPNNSLAFTGIFDGNGHTINNLTIQNGNVAGLLGFVGNGGQIKNFGLVNATIAGQYYMGGLCGHNSGTISKCYITGSVSGISYTGGLCGNNLGTITQSYTTASVTGTSNNIGGLCGYNQSGTITFCYAAGHVTGSYAVGGLIGYCEGYPIACFWDTQISGQSGSSGGKGLTTNQMKTMSIFQNSGWADKGWIIDDGIDYPRLDWENTAGTPIPQVQTIPLSGSGTAADPYLITTPQDFALLSWYLELLDDYFELTTDLDLEEVELYPIGDLEQFAGVFDGNGHTLSNVVINQPGNTNVGLLSCINQNGRMKNLGLENVNIQGIKNVGGIAGNSSGTITSCYVTGTINTTNDCAGGLIGKNYGTIVSSYSTAAVSGISAIGGLAGWTSTDTITSCYTAGAVNGTSYVGGLLGWSSQSTVTDCYAAGPVSGLHSIGGLCGYKEDGVFSHCFWDTQTSGRTTSAAGEGKTTVEMQTASTFIDAGWDFDSPVWMINGADYPRLVWNRPDIDENGQVNLADFALLAQNWQTEDCGFCDGTDLTGDQNVDLYDLSILAADWLADYKISSHVFEIGIEMARDYEAPGDPDDTEYEFSMEIMTDDTIQWIEFLTPAGQIFEITPGITEYEDAEGNWFEFGKEFDSESNQWEWWYEAEYVSNDSLAAYGDGEYTITFYYAGGWSQRTTVWFGIPDSTDPIPQPTQEPSITSFNDGDTVTSPFTVYWQACADANVNHIYLEFENDTEYGFDFGSGTTDTGTVLNVDAGQYDVYLGFEVDYGGLYNDDGIQFWVGKYTETDYIITVTENPISNHVTEIEIYNGWDFESPQDAYDNSYNFGFEVMTDTTVERIEFLTPAGNTFEITSEIVEYSDMEGNYFESGREYDAEYDGWEWWYEVEYINVGSLDAYGDGVYTITVYYTDGRSQQTTAWFGIPGITDPLPQPTQQPVITSFDSGDTLTSPITLTWNTCTDAAADHIWLSVFTEDDSQEMEWGLPLSATGLGESLALTAGQWVAELGFEIWDDYINDDGIVIDIGKYSGCDCLFTIE